MLVLAVLAIGLAIVGMTLGFGILGLDFFYKLTLVRSGPDYAPMP